MGRGLATIIATWCALAITSSAAATTVDLGQTAPASGGATTSVVNPVIQAATSGGSPNYSVPFRAVVTQWSYRNRNTGSQTARLYVAELRSAAPTFFIRARSDEMTVPGSTRQTFAVRIPVEAGDLLGVHSSDVDTYAGASGDVVRQLDSIAATGDTVGAAASQTPFLVNVAARIESDGDADGHGDDTQDNCPGAANADQANADGDAQGNACDGDDDNDGVGDGTDAFPLDASESLDTDFDGVGNNADADDDNDGSADDADAFPLDAAESRDVDLDGIGDNADGDDDNDGVSDVLESGRGTSSLDRDTDDDGVADGDETRSNPLRADTDRDGLTDGVETNVTRPVDDPAGEVAGTDLAQFRPDRDPRTRTDPLKKDTDRDKLADGREDRNRNGKRERRETDPRKRDTDRDRIPDGRDRKPLKRGR